MTISTKTFTTLVTDMATAVQGAASVLIDMTIGSILRAVVEAVAALGMWLQGLILQVLALTRAATSSGTDLDSWVWDFGITRLPAIAATGLVTFSRFTATAQAVVPIGTKVQTADGSQQYAVTLDIANPAYSATLGAYVLAPGAASIQAPVQALTAGAAANAAAGQINTLAQATPGIDTVTNTLNFTTGQDAESDAALRLRFVAFMAALSRATPAAIAYAINSVQTGVAYTLIENQNYDGSTHYGYFYVVVDDGTGAPSSAFLNAVYAAIDAVRPLTVWFAVFPPVEIVANVSMTLTLAAGYGAETRAAVQTAVQAYITALTLGMTLPYTKLAQIAYDTSPGVLNVTAITLNGATADIAATNKQVIKPGTVTVS